MNKESIGYVRQTSYRTTFYFQETNPQFMQHNLARFLKANMWHLTKYARFVDTATTSSESKNTWEVINY
jgi:hypothetical protein